MNPNSNSLSTVGMHCPDPVRESHVCEWLNRLDKAVRENREMALQIDQRFATVLRSQPAQSTAPDQDKAPQEYLVDVADKLRTLFKEIEVSNAILSSIHQRTEL